MRRFDGWVLAVVLAAVVTLGACASDGRTISKPQSTSGATVASGAPISSAPGVGSAAGALVLSSTAFLDGAAIPAQYTCDGPGDSPPLLWTGVPSGISQLVLTVIDPDAGGYVHWVVTQLPPALRSISAGALPEGVIEGPNSTGSPGWTGPCPPRGTAHHYVFTLYALPPGCTAADDSQARACAIATATLTGIYQRA